MKRQESKGLNALFGESGLIGRRSNCQIESPVSQLAGQGGDQKPLKNRLAARSKDEILKSLLWYEKTAATEKTAVAGKNIKNICCGRAKHLNLCGGRPFGRGTPGRDSENHLVI